MSRIGKQPVAIPSGVEVKIAGEAINVKGPKGSISTPVEATLNYEIADGKVVITRKDESRVARAQHGLRRTLVANCIDGVSKGFSKTLEVNGVGYKVAVKGKNVELAVGFSHPVVMPLPEGIEAKAEGNKLTISGIDKQLVGEFAATVRRVRPPEPYKGKGIKYDNEQIRRKAGKSAGK
ncbi:50S ribosomal protein L6 [Halodesulfovibrio sp.]|jgi:large subunit ribosomal protein L6|uniref:50S ribosomal protein L6 n=1 Tax=Halodesulfovibrio sp. TaxID=1912772 RepID=UPI0025F0684D|nr:50S ribosomal protein L6 [Halodesulfovibrio sp.]MCT4534025.1 50S ribosomal protein L6 [Halodesulfovibrio sp.]MCT4627150.1 50S ribosomal protein L6 [Halodesulfovibrio sp.]